MITEVNRMWRKFGLPKSSHAVIIFSPYIKVHPNFEPFVISIWLFDWILPAPFDISLSSRNIELFLGYSQGRAGNIKRGEKQKNVFVWRLPKLTQLLSMLTEFCYGFSKICFQTSCLFPRCVIIVWNANNLALSGAKPADPLLIIDYFLNYQLLNL